MKIQIKLIGYVLLMVLLASCSGSTKKTEIVNLFPVRNGTVYRYIDREGKVIINPQFKEASIFRNGLALVQTFGTKPMWGYINSNGSFAINARYKEGTIFNEEIAWVVSDNGAPEAINSKGETLFTLKRAKSVRIFNEGLAAFSISSDSTSVKWGFVDKNGIVKIAPQYSAVSNFSNGKCAVASSSGEWGYIDTEGNIIIKYQYTNAKYFVTGNAVMSLGKEWGVIDASGKFIISPKFSEIKADQDGYLIKQNNKWGWSDKKSTITIDPQYDDAFPFNGNELAVIKSGNKFGYINKKGKKIIDTQFDIALPFNGKLAWVMNSGKGGFIDPNAKYVISPQYDAISEDLKDYLLDGSSAFESVTSDYFDMDTIVNRLKKDIKENSVAGLNFNSTMQDVYTKLKKTEYDFIKNSTEHLVIAAERLSNDATLDLFILGTPWTETYNGKLGFSYTLKPNYIHTGFSIRIKLTGKGLDKETILLKALETSLTGYTKDEKHSNENVTILSSKSQLIVAMKERGIIIIAIYPITPENLQMIDENYSNGLESDSTVMETDTIKNTIK